MQINRALAQSFTLILATVSLAACDQPAPRAGESRPVAPRYTQGPPLPPPPAARRPLPTVPAAPYAAPAFTPPPAPYAQGTGTDWRDLPLPAGDWAWTARATGSEARYGQSGSPPIAILACDRAAGVVRLALTLPYMASEQTGTRSATITTSTSTGTFAAGPQTIGALSTIAVTLPVSNRILDAMAYSRGRFRIEIGAMAPIVLPSWSEVGRVVEDCRGQR
ncbi:hypothetical protein [Novosphingobium sp.]|uniref:hypothetical protein n=1 Tax=Novosphingobium sp. TaxID=1874826 RepID=UPI003B51A487